MDRDPILMAELTAKRLHPYNTILIKLYIDGDGKLKAQQLGSGTYVKIGEMYGVLTAYHCTTRLEGNYRLGLSASLEGNEHHFHLEPSSIKIFPIAIPISDELGPDLAFISILDWEDISTIQASKQFLNIERDRDRMLSNPPDNDKSLWYICGVPNLTFLPSKSESGFEETFEFQDLCGAGGVDRIFSNGGFDYSEMHFVPGIGAEPPSTFGGMSGGGLWQVPWLPPQTSIYLLPDLLLAGVIFYQGVTDEGIRFLRCHFRESIYRNAIEVLI